MIVFPSLCNFFPKLITVYVFFSFIFISWRLISLQYCSGFCHTLTWISHGFTCIPHPDPPSHLPLHLIPLGLSSAPALVSCIQPGLVICFLSMFLYIPFSLQCVLISKGHIKCARLFPVSCWCGYPHQPCHFSGNAVIPFHLAHPSLDGTHLPVAC